MKTTLVCLGLGLSIVGCKGEADPELLKRVSEANDKVVTCKSEANELKAQLATVKRQLAQAVAGAANRIELTDPEIINLIAEIKKKSGPVEGDEVVIGKGDLNPKDASRVVKQGALAMQVCYERALKKNASLQFQAGLAVVLELTVKPTGAVQGVEVKPAVDADMNSCIQTAAMRWKFPTFSGQPVVIAQKITLTPKT
jgi:hypothetical protein